MLVERHSIAIIWVRKGTASGHITERAQECKWKGTQCWTALASHIREDEIHDSISINHQKLLPIDEHQLICVQEEGSRTTTTTNEKASQCWLNGTALSLSEWGRVQQVGITERACECKWKGITMLVEQYLPHTSEKTGFVTAFPSIIRSCF